MHSTVPPEYAVPFRLSEIRIVVNDTCRNERFLTPCSARPRCRRVARRWTARARTATVAPRSTTSSPQETSPLTTPPARTVSTPLAVTEPSNVPAMSAISTSTLPLKRPVPATSRTRQPSRSDSTVPSTISFSHRAIRPDNAIDRGTVRRFPSLSAPGAIRRTKAGLARGPDRRKVRSPTGLGQRRCRNAVPLAGVGRIAHASVLPPEIACPRSFDVNRREKGAGSASGPATLPSACPFLAHVLSSRSLHVRQARVPERHISAPDRVLEISVEFVHIVGTLSTDAAPVIRFTRAVPDRMRAPLASPWYLYASVASASILAASFPGGAREA